MFRRLFKSPESNPGKLIPQHLVNAEDLDKLLIRGCLFSTNLSYAKTYLSVIAPLSLELRGDITSQVSKEENTLFKQFVAEVLAIRKKYNDVYKEPKDLQLVALHRLELVETAKKFCKSAEDLKVSLVIFPQLATITENIAARKIVENYSSTTDYVPAGRKGYGTCT